MPEGNPMPDIALDTPETGKETLASHVYDQLRQDIISVAIEPGEKLHIRSLCERFDVGLSPMREALSRLSTEGLVAQSDHRGFAVAPMGEQDLVDITRARCWLNELAIRKSIAHGDAAWEEQGKKDRDEFYGKLLKHLRGEPNDIESGTNGMAMARIAEGLVTERPELMLPSNKEGLLRAIEVIYERDRRASMPAIIRARLDEIRRFQNDEPPLA